MKDTSKEQQLENIRQSEANNAIEGIHMHPDDKALLLRAVKEGWSDEKLNYEMDAQLIARGVYDQSQAEAPSAAAE